MTDQCLIAEFTKNSVEKIKVHLQRWKNQTYVDLRVYFVDDEMAEQPTKKGITLNIELLSELRKAIDAALAEVELGEKPGKVGEIPEKASKV